MYEPRTYRQNFNDDRFKSFNVVSNETDLCIAVDNESFNENMIPFIEERIKAYRKQLDDYIIIDPNFKKQLKPVEVQDDAPEIAKQMALAGSAAETGPMAAVAGAFSQYIGNDIIDNFEVKELIIENGGDIFLKIESPLTISVHAGDSPVSEHIGIVIPETFSPCGVCTSAGTVGHSISFGKADAVVVACKNALLADAYATAFGNKVKKESGIEPLIKKIADIEEVEFTLIIMGEAIGAKGEFELCVINNK